MTVTGLADNRTDYRQHYRHGGANANAVRQVTAVWGRLFELGEVKGRRISQLVFG
jgi:hypothetical protein